jgi:hypothetical protein
MIAKYLHFYIWTVLFFIHLYTLRRSQTRHIERIKRKSSRLVLSPKKKKNQPKCMNNFEKQKLQDILILTSILIHKKEKEEKREKTRLKKSLVLKGHLITMKKVPLLRGGTFQI